MRIFTVFGGFCLMLLYINQGLAEDDKQRTINEGKIFASEQNTKAIAAGEATENEFIPGYNDHANQVNQQKELYIEGDEALQAAGEDARTANDTAIFYSDANDNRPVIELDEDSDPLFMRLDETKDIAQQLTTNNYQGCVDLPIGNPDPITSENKVCYEEGIITSTYPTCTRSWVAQCSNFSGNNQTSNVIDYDVSVNVADRNTDTVVRVDIDLLNNVVLFSESGGAKFYEFDSFLPSDFVSTYCDTGWNITITVQVADWNGAQEVGGVDNNTWRAFENGVVGCPSMKVNYTLFDTFDFRDCRFDMDEACEQKVLFRENIAVTFNINVHAELPCDVEYVESYLCAGAATYPLENLLSTACVDSDNPKTFNGLIFEKTCWEEEEVYQIRNVVLEEEPYCEQLRSESCTFQSRECVDTVDGFCIKNEITYECRSSDTRHVQICGTQISCPDGECTSEYIAYEDNTEAFQRAATNLEMVRGIAKDFNQDTMTVFTGENMKCKKKAVGLSDCCADSGWGLDTGLLSCSEEEETLGRARQDEKAHYVGRYTSGGFLDKRRYYVFCVYGSKLSRIVIEQGNIQLGKEYGTPKNPICEGFSLDELYQLDFSTMDLSEFYQDVQENADNAERPSLQDMLDSLSGGGE